MAQITPDFSQTEKPLKPGTYTVRVKEYKCATSKQSNDRYIRWGLEVVDQGDFLGCMIQNTTMIEGRAAGMLKHFLKSCDGQYDGGPFDPDSYIGSRLGIEVNEREYQGKQTPNVKAVFPLEGGTSGSPAHTEEDIPF